MFIYPMNRTWWWVVFALGVTLLNASSVPGDECSGIEGVCLSGGPHGPHEGNVFVNGKPVCDDLWSVTDANIVCKQLNFTRARSNTFYKKSNKP